MECQHRSQEVQSIDRLSVRRDLSVNTACLFRRMMSDCLPWRPTKAFFDSPNGLTCVRIIRFCRGFQQFQHLTYQSLEKNLSTHVDCLGNDKNNKIIKSPNSHELSSALQYFPSRSYFKDSYEPLTSCSVAQTGGRRLAIPTFPSSKCEFSLIIK